MVVAVAVVVVVAVAVVVVSVLAFFSDDPSLNPAETYRFRYL